MSIFYVCCRHATQGFTLVLSRQSMFLVIYAILTCLLSVVFGQPLQMPPESFPCGSSHDICERWGYVTCIFRDGEHNCFPCSHEYLSTLCGTKEETQGCNLFCADKALEKEGKKLQSEFSSRLTNLQTNYTIEKKHLQSVIETNSEVKETEVVTLRKEKNVQGNITKSLEGEVRKKTDYISHLLHSVIGLSTSLGVLALLYVTLAVYVWRRMCCCNKKTCSDCEAPEPKFQLLPKDEDTRRKDEYEDQQNRSVLPSQDKSVQTDWVTEELEQKPDESTRQKVRKCHEGVCPGKAMLQNISPTEHHGSFVMAIKNQEFSPQISN